MLSTVEDTRQPKYCEPALVGYCAECNQPIHENEYRLQTKLQTTLQGNRIKRKRDYMCDHCFKTIDRVVLVDWIGSDGAECVKGL